MTQVDPSLIYQVTMPLCPLLQHSGSMENLHLDVPGSIYTYHIQDVDVSDANNDLV